MAMRTVAIGALSVANDRPFTLIAGPCQIESAAHAMEMASALVEMTAALGIGLIFKSSYDKANRTSVSAGRGVGIAVGLQVLADIRAKFGVPVLTDVHDVAQVTPVAEAVDVLQIPAFLSRQTDLLLAAGASGRAVNVKKGQFLAPWDMRQVAAKLASTGNQRILLTERGASFGYNTLVSDFRALPIMAQTGYPVVFDATHSVQQPGGQGHASGGQREFVPALARAALAVGCAGLFIECHDDPDHAPSDGPNMLALRDMPGLLAQLQRYDALTKA
ncbi:MAG: 3-deoxy-8-phosphooctulonate synthase [Acidiphilium sp. 21-60-14]|nr:MAG: 3-deoxy-8-phosphooctulonate synthase [Acidiphilium sp. 21-60-14]OYV89842.1 MAG: 3-deoxy-8-phosphooctulonate synthase [Acidiphilium sp. 37-60-79]OZB38486.1 MAG: 3-deoxy-8-phosphooctulonate synthase [Acidiphilium sp. 34-60-192]